MRAAPLVIPDLQPAILTMPDDERTVKLSDIGFATSTLFNTLSEITVAMLIGLHVWLW